MDNKIYADKINELIDGYTPEMFAMLEKAVNMDSGTFDVADVNALGDWYAGQLEALGGQVIRHPAAKAGFAVSGAFLPPGAPADARRVILVGHRDTVFPAGTAAERPFTRDAAKCYGPGIIDQKGGNIIGFFAIKALLAMRDLTGPLPMEILYTSDEESGSADSAPTIVKRCKNAKAAFFLEPARAGGELVTGRSGGAIFRLDVHGKAAHAGNNFPDGRSAINALASVIRECATLSDDKAGHNLNVGVIGGGEGVFIVPGHAFAEASMRFATREQYDSMFESLRQSIAEHGKDGIRIEINKPVVYLPFGDTPDNRSMFELTREAGRAFGLDLKGVSTGGAGDAGQASSHGVPTLDGLGPVGGNMHTAEEYMNSETFPERAKVLALAMILAARRFA